MERPDRQQPDSSRQRLGIALGAGGARGFAHVGVLKVLERHGIVPDVVAGASMGAMVGAAYAAGLSPREIERFILKTSILELIEFDRSGMAVFSTRRIGGLIRTAIGDPDFRDLARPFAVVAGSVGRGHLVVLHEGSVVEAVLASIALPGIFTPGRHGDDYLFDGGIIESVPCDAARRLGAARVIAVDLSLGWVNPFQCEPVRTAARTFLRYFPPPRAGEKPGLAGVLLRMVDVLSGPPSPQPTADVMLQPRFGNITPNHFHLARECIAIGENIALERVADLLACAGLRVPGGDRHAREPSSTATAQVAPAVPEHDGVPAPRDTETGADALLSPETS